MIEGYDLVADGSDNFATRDAVHAACLRLGKTLVSAAVQGLEGQLTTYKAHLGPPHPCYRCLFPSEPPPDLIPTCAQGGVLGPAVGVVGSLQAVEVVKEILGLGDSLSGHAAAVRRAGHPLSHGSASPGCPDCPVCGAAAATERPWLRLSA